MSQINRVYTAVESFFHNVPIRQITRELHNTTLCHGQAARDFFGKSVYFLQSFNFN